MHPHGPSCLPGPITRDLDLWSVPAGSDSAPIRHDLVERIRREIAQGTYDTPDRFEAAMQQLFRRLDAD